MDKLTIFELKAERDRSVAAAKTAIDKGKLKDATARLLEAMRAEKRMAKLINKKEAIV